MNICIKTDVNGYFSYKVYRENPENIIYESSLQKNLIVNTGLEHLYTKTIPEAIQLLDLGISRKAASPTDTGLLSPNFTYSNIFNDLLALSVNRVFIPEESVSEYTAFFRTKTTSSPIILQEFVIKPGARQNAFARQVFFPINLQSGDGIEFTYKVRASWPCAQTSSSAKLLYNRQTIGTKSSDELPLTWSYSPSAFPLNFKKWSKLYSDRNKTLIAVCSGTNSGDTSTPSSIFISNDNGVSWLSGYTTDNDLISEPLNSIASGTVPSFTNPKENTTLYLGTSTLNVSSIYYPILESETRDFIHRYVVVGSNNVTYHSNTSSSWVSGSISGSNIDWQDIAFGKVTKGSTNSLDLTASYVPTFVAVGSAAGIYSSDGISWQRSTDPILSSTHRDLSSSRSNWTSIIYGKNFVTIADSGSARIAYSSDGKNWLSARPPALNQWSDIAYNELNDTYVAVSKNFAAYSPIMYASGGDLSKWLPVQYPLNKWASITCGNGVFVAVGGDTGISNERIIYSIDGKTWEPILQDITNQYVSWKSIDYIDNTFVAVANLTGQMDTPFVRSTVNSKTTNQIDINTKISLLNIPPGDRIIKRTYPMYTLRSLDMPTQCASAGIVYNELLYSSTVGSNSFALPATTLISPNTALSVYTFTNAGHGSIKNLLITDEVFNNNSILSGIWGIELDVNKDNIIFDNPVTTGDTNSIISLTPTEGSLTRNIPSQTQNVVIDNQLSFYICQIWGTDRSSYNTTQENRSFATFDAPSGWKIYDATGYLGRRTSSGVLYGSVSSLSSFIGLYKDISYIDFPATLNCSTVSSTITEYFDFDVRIKTNKPSALIIKNVNNDYDDISRAYIRIVPSQNNYNLSNIFAASKQNVPGEVAFLNSILITPSMLLDIFNDSSNKNIGEPIVEDVVFLPQENKIKLYFKPNTLVRPDYVISTGYELKSTGTCSISSITNYQFIPFNTKYNVYNS